MEEWKDIKGFEGLYQISNLGNVKSLNYHMTGKEQILKQEHSDARGYKRITLSKDGKTIRVLVHRLVWESFNGDIPEGYQINHLDENPCNNNLENLNLVTPQENLNYGKHNQNISLSLINNKVLSRVVKQYDLDGNFIKEWPSLSEIKRQLNYSVGNIFKCCQGKYKQAYKYIWRYG